MSDRRVERTERPRDEGVFVSRTEEDKKDKEKFSPLPGPDEKQLMFATFFNYLKKLFDTFSPSTTLAGKVIDQQEIIATLTKLKHLLETLSKEDVSQTPAFAIALSEVWSLLMEQSDHLAILERKKQGDATGVKDLFNEIKHYPLHSEHSLGFYLYAHAGKDWLPFPFIEILHELYKGHQDAPSKSTLSNWLQRIDEIIEKLKAQISFTP